MLQIIIKFRLFILPFICLTLLTGAQDQPTTEKEIFLNFPLFGDFRKAEKILQPGQASLKVWDQRGDYLRKFYGSAPELGASKEHKAFSYDEIWVLKHHDYLKLGQRKGTRREPDLVKLYWKKDRVVGLSVERAFKLDPLTFQPFEGIEYRLMAIYPRDYLLNELTRQALKETTFHNLPAPEHLREAQKALAEGNPDAEDLRQRTYGRLEDARRHLEAITRKDEEYGEAKELLKEVHRREKDLKKYNEAMAQAAEEQEMKRRQEQARELDREFLTKGFDVKVELQGSAKDAIILNSVLFNRPMVFFFLDKSDLLKQLKDAGFRGVAFNNNATKYSWEIDLDGL
jgi:hypothetical protein